MIVYFAGPDVFRNDYASIVKAQAEVSEQYGLTPIFPFDSHGDTANDIFAENARMVKNADVVIANLNPFRGSEPDSGTVVEITMAAMLGKRVIAYISDDRPQIDKISPENGTHVEDFDLPVNLMIACQPGIEIIRGGYIEAIQRIGTKKPQRRF